MNVDDHPDSGAEPRRRSQRLMNKQNTPRQLSGDKFHLFTHDFKPKQQTRQHRTKRHRHKHGRNNKKSGPISKLPMYPTISRCARKLNMVHHSPNVFIIENFLTNKECQHLLQIVNTNSCKFEVSYTQATGADQIYSAERTSSFIFLQKYMDQVSRSIEGRAAEIVSMPIQNVEPLQLVRYTDGQEFTLHHDAGTLINETLKKVSSCSLWSLTSTNSDDSNASKAQHAAAHSSWSSLHSASPQPLPLASAQYYQKWQALQQQMALQTAAMTAVPGSTRPQSCPPQHIASNARQLTPTPPPVSTSTSNPQINAMSVKYKTGSAPPLSGASNVDGDDESSDVKMDKMDKDAHEFDEINDEFSVEIVSPARVFSFFVYLTTLPQDAGGETYFPKLGLKVRPVRGKAILWCNVDPRNANHADPMLIHRACPVRGSHLKIGMNIWINNTQVDVNYL